MKIRGNTVGTTVPRPDWNQENEKRADFILNKPPIERGEGEDSVSCGKGNTVTGKFAGSGGRNNNTSGDYAYTNGFGNTASATCAVSMGNQCKSTQNGAVSWGSRTVANAQYQTARGISNIPDTPDNNGKGKYVDIVGNGNSNNPSNAYTLDWQGNGWFAGGVYVGGTSQSGGAQKLVTATDLKAKKVATGTYDGDNGFVLSRTLTAGKNYMIEFQNLTNSEVSVVHLKVNSPGGNDVSTANMAVSSTGVFILRFKYGFNNSNKPCLFAQVYNMADGTYSGNDFTSDISVSVYELPY